MKNKRFIVRKYIIARNAKEAIKKDKTTPVDDVWVDEKWLEESTKQDIGFKANET